MPGRMNCPRCGAPLREKEATRRWQQFFECGKCFRAFELVTERHRAPCALNPNTWFIRTTITLQPGRTRMVRS